VSPDGQDIFAPRFVAGDLNNLLQGELLKLKPKKVRINVIEHDYANQDLISTVIDYNDVF
jgi:hypothetical protein